MIAVFYMLLGGILVAIADSLSEWRRERRRVASIARRTREWNVLMEQAHAIRQAYASQQSEAAKGLSWTPN